ncbi:PREDICTED: pentatricopeptide repeat-containing protein At3g60960, mitochondrial-like [Camelina sativa]|uniref:Pentatricopeptide repeat-containing protein At3g60960, mitochondrial-like n=1 Tax=Camelina sativa TaxID=90675 RepID=A0ABM0WQ42_CAMSA|nr:PREDICTED: pentatricopeptide repeat-containing protein At3g60960, mitochondrial-like [Camelina sativa]
MRNLSSFPLGRKPSSLPWKALTTKKVDQNSTATYCEDDRPISLRFRVSSMIELCQLDKAAQMSSLAASDEYVDLPYTVPMICNKIIGAMYDAKRYDDAIALFHYFFNKSDLIPDIFTYNLIIKIHCDENNVDDAFELYRYAKTLAVPDIDTHMALVKGLLMAGRIVDALGFVKTQKLWDSEVYSYLVRGFLDLGNHEKAYELFHEFDHHIMLHHSEDHNIRRAAVEATFVEYWFKQGKDEKLWRFTAL